MPTLTVNNGWLCPLPGLGKKTRFDSLSEKRITKSAREVLRRKYGQPNVTVSCSAEFDGSVWVGTCEIHGQPFRYRISV